MNERTTCRRSGVGVWARFFLAAEWQWGLCHTGGLNLCWGGESLGEGFVSVLQDGPQVCFCS